MLFKKKAKNKKSKKIHEALFQSELVYDNPKMEEHYFSIF